VPVYSVSRLATGVTAQTATESKIANAERNRRAAERELYGELSRYYLLKPSQKEWTRPTLLPHGKHEHLTQ